MQDRYVRVRLLDAPFFLDREYDYHVPEEFCAQVAAGSFVTVPFGGGNRRQFGVRACRIRFTLLVLEVETCRILI